MARNRANVVKGPWCKSRTLSPLEVYTASQNYWFNIKETRKSLLSYRRTLHSSTTIQPNQCDSIITFLHEVILSIQAFYKFLDKQGHSIQISRYPALNSLIESEILLEGLINDMVLFREHCWMPSSQTTLSLQNIEQKFDSFFSTWKIMQKCITTFLDYVDRSLDEYRSSCDYPQANILHIQERAHQTSAGNRIHLPNSNNACL